MVTYNRFLPYVGFNMSEVSLYIVPVDEERRQRHLVLKLPRDGDLGEACPNVRIIRAMEKAALMAMADQVDEGVRPKATS